jgi:hypothetical protein
VLKKNSPPQKSGGGSVKEVVLPPMRSDPFGHWLQLFIKSQDHSYSLINPGMLRPCHFGQIPKHASQNIKLKMDKSVVVTMVPFVE